MAILATIVSGEKKALRKPANVGSNIKRRKLPKRNMKEELQNIIDDFGGGRKKESEKSQLFYNIATEVLWKLNERPYSDVEQFTKYLKEVAKKISSVNILGKE